MIEKKPHPNELYRRIAKDYQPKAAEMAICQCVQELEQRIIALEKELEELKKPQIETVTTETKVEDVSVIATAVKKGRKKNV